MEWNVDRDRQSYIPRGTKKEEKRKQKNLLKTKIPFFFKKYAILSKIKNLARLGKEWIFIEGVLQIIKKEKDVFDFELFF